MRATNLEKNDESSTAMPSLSRVGLGPGAVREADLYAGRWFCLIDGETRGDALCVTSPRCRRSRRWVWSNREATRCGGETAWHPELLRRRRLLGDDTAESAASTREPPPGRSHVIFLGPPRDT